MAAIRVHNIVMEASSKDDQKYMASMSKNDINQINGGLLQNLYGAVLDRKNIDFGDIEDSAGDIEKLKYYKNDIACLDTLEELYRKNNIDEPVAGTVRTAISNMKKYRPQFQTGFKMKHDFIMLTYNSLCMAITDAVSTLIAEYMTYVVSTNDTKYSLNPKGNRGRVPIDSLESFNRYCQDDRFGQALDFMIGEQKKAFMGDTVIITGAIVLILLSIVPLIREIVYFYYKSRVKISDYLNMQADFLEMNKLAVEASNRGPAEKKSIIKKQDAVIKKMRRNADKIQINNVDTNDVIKKEVKDENSLWSLNNIEKQLSKNKLDGASFTIV